VFLLRPGGQGLTSRATRKSDQKDVVLKVLDFLVLSSWKNYDLFLREIAILKTLNHPAVPKVLAVFPETPQDNEPEAVVLVQEYFEGDSLKALLDEENEAWSEKNVLAFLAEMLEILAYLHSLNPPVVHRDIKPSNIILRQDGSYALIDFGAATSTQKTNASTFVGTNGYMAPEQMMGRAEPRSDLYSLGATALQLATGLHPSDLTRENFAFRLDDLGLSPRLLRILERLVHPLPEKRFQGVRQAQQRLNPSQDLVKADISENGFKLVRQDDCTNILLPRPHLGLIALYALISVMGVLAILFEGASRFQNISVLIWAGLGIFQLTVPGRVLIDDEGIRFMRGLGPFSRVKAWAVDDISDIRSQKTGAFLTVVVQDKAGKKQSVGALSGAQAQWLVRHVLEELEERR